MRATTYGGVHYICFLYSMISSRFSWRPSRRRLISLTVCATLLALLMTYICPCPLLAASLSLDPSSGPPGTVITVTGSGFEAFNFADVWFDSDGDGIYDDGEPHRYIYMVTSALPAGLTLTVPGVEPGIYQVLIDVKSDGSVEASATFIYAVDLLSLTLLPASGPAGTEITVSGSGFSASTAGWLWFDSNSDGIRDAGEPQVAVTSTAEGELPAGITLTVPALSDGTYPVQADIPDGDDIEASADFTISAPEISLDPDSGSLGTVITVIGSSFPASTSGWVWFDTSGDSVRDAEEPQVSVTSTAAGELPAGVQLTVPMVEPSTSCQVRADIPDGGGIEASAAFATTGTTVSLMVTRYDAYGTVLDTETVDYLYMQSSMPVQGDAVRRQYFQGPTFDDSTFETTWNPGEMVNIDSRDYGRPLGTDVKDLCGLVGGASPGDVIRIRASDNFAKWFDYEDVYNPEPEQGRLVVCWYNPDFGGFVPAYNTGMRLVFFAETTNPEGKYVFGNWDMHETLPKSRWHFYYGGSGGGTDVNFWPSSSGLSVQKVYNIEIFQPNLVTCDAVGNPLNSYQSGDTVYVKGLGLSPDTGYKLWIQDEPVLSSQYDSYERPLPGVLQDLDTGGDPSGGQETVITDGNGDFDPVAIWNVGYSGDSAAYDVVADNQASGTAGKYDSADEIDCPGWEGFSVTVFSEIISFTVTDFGDDGIDFGALDPGSGDQPADGQPEQGTVTLTVGSETSVDVDIRLKGTDFTGLDTIDITSVKYDDDADPDGAIVLTDTYTTWYTVYQPLTSDDVTGVYHWISIPAGQTPGSYSGTFYYQAISSP